MSGCFLKEITCFELINSIPEITIIHDFEKIVFINDFGKIKLGYKDESLILEDVFSKEYIELIKKIELNKESYVCKGAKCLELDVHKGCRTIKTKLKSKVGNFIDVEISFLCVGKNIYSISEDLSKVVLMEDKLNKSAKNLKKIKDQVIQQEKLAGIGHLAAGIAHEINNPLGFVISNFEVMGKYLKAYKEVIEKVYSKHSKDKEILEMIEYKNIEFINEDVKYLMEDCFEGLKRIEKIVRGLRTFSRETNSNDFEAYDLNEGINSTLIVARNEIKYFAEIELNLGEIVSIEAIGGQINQVILNLIINAVQAIKEKNIEELGKIKINTFLEEDNLVLEVEDNGIGIKEEVKEKIFDPFYTTKPAGIGTGLGLGIANEIIKNNHNGEIEVKSEYNVGTKFKITLPIRRPKKRREQENYPQN